jgi:hypothetical protein
MNTWEDVGIDVHGRGAGPEVKTTCPQCSPFRKKKSYRCLSVNLDRGVWHCWHCAWSGSLAKGSDMPSLPSRPPERLPEANLYSPRGNVASDVGMVRHTRHSRGRCTPPLSAIITNLAMQQGWTFAVCSPENVPLERYVARLLELYAGAPFSAGAIQRMSRDMLEQAKTWLDAHVCFLLPEEHSPTVAHLLDLARTQVFRMGVKGLLIDPWNELDHSRTAHLQETEYISQALSEIRRFARQHQVHTWLVAHPTKLVKGNDGQYPVPTAYDIAGSAHWRNKADNIVSVWRDVTASDHRVQVHVQKIRFREVGHLGMVELVFDPLTGRFRECRVSTRPRD